LVIDAGSDMVGTPDGIALVRARPKNGDGITQEYLFYALRSEVARLQLWTESGGTSYGKLTDQHIRDLILPKPSPDQLATVTKAVSGWAASIRSASKVWNTIGSDRDRVPIINSPIFGLEPEDEG
jgi:type I restriction enzyme M protein